MPPSKSVIENHAPKPQATRRTRAEATAIPELRAYDGPATRHTLKLGDARELDWIPDQSVHLVVTSPPYFNLKKYNDHPSQLGDMDEYEAFHDELDKVWTHCFRILAPGGRLVCNVGDVCVARRKNNGRHHVFPLHADISVRCRRIGFDYLTPILWNKIANAAFEAEGNGGGFLGKPYEPNAIIKNDVEYILMLRKPGAYRKPTDDQRATSRLTKEEQAKWFRPVWTDLTGASTRDHPAPYPIELAYRLIRMFSFTGDSVFDPFGGTGTTSIAAIRTDRNSILTEIDPDYFARAARRVKAEASEGVLGRPSPAVEVIETKPTRRSPTKRGRSSTARSA
ncbi:MAG: site-specific DNA-methyltransferase [Phycisphaerales bacterium]|nr:site-specific DNA-methyltransferase [Phycisphaerales bacterium]